MIWTALVGKSGTAKSPAMKAALWPVERRERQAARDFPARQAEYAADLLRYEVDLTAWKRSGCKKGEPEPEKPVPPICQRFMVSDVTVVAIADRLADNPRGLLEVRDELSGLLRSFDQYKAGKGGDCAHWLSMFDATALRMDRKTGDRRTIYVPNAAVSICGGIQPEVFRAALGREHFADGLAARFLLAMPPRRPARWTDAEIPDALGEQVADVFDRLWELEPEQDQDGEPFPRSLGLTAGAKRVWVPYFDRHGDEQVELEGDLAAAWSKLRGYAARLALVVHWIRWAAGADVDPDAIDAESTTAGIALSDWFGNEARRVYAALSETDEQRDERCLLEWLRAEGRLVTPREITRGLRRFRGEAGAVDKVLGRLQKKGVGRFVPEHHDGGRGRPTMFFELLPGGDGDENGQSPGKTGIVSPSPPRDNRNGRRPHVDPETVNRLLAEGFDHESDME